MPDNAAPLILLTRPRAQADRFAADCAARFGDAAAILIAPLIEIVPGAALPDLAGIDGLIFTSENGVRAFAAAPGARHGLPAYCVGDRTAATARDAGLVPHSAGGTADDLVALLLSQRPSGQLLHVHGAHVTGDLAGRLRAGGLQAQGLAAYDQLEQPLAARALAALNGPRVVIAPLFSPRSAMLFARALGGAVPARTALPCLSPAVCAALPAGYRDSATICDAPTGEAMLSEIARQLGP